MLGAMFAGWRLVMLSDKTDGIFHANFWDREGTMWFPLIVFSIVFVLAMIPIGPGRVAWYDHVADTYISRRTSRPVARGFEPILRSE